LRVVENGAGGGIPGFTSILLFGGTETCTIVPRSTVTLTLVTKPALSAGAHSSA
jgi:hypothetical protein